MEKPFVYIELKKAGGYNFQSHLKIIRPCQPTTQNYLIDNNMNGINNLLERKEAVKALGRENH